MDQHGVGARLKAFLEQKFPSDGVELQCDTNLLEDWFIDSLGIVETVLFIEEEFNVPIARVDINGTNFRDLASLSSFVAARMKE